MQMEQNPQGSWQPARSSKAVCRWNPKRVFAIQPSFTAWVDLGSLKELSGGEAEVGVRPWALLCREGPRVTRLPFFLLTRWLELSLSTSGFSASIHRALSTRQLRSARSTLQRHFLHPHNTLWSGNRSTHKEFLLQRS